jgi:hypothetical protein
LRLVTAVPILFGSMFGSPGLASGEPGRSPVFGTAATVTVTDHRTAAGVAGEWEVPEDR